MFNFTGNIIVAGQHHNAGFGYSPLPDGFTGSLTDMAQRAAAMTPPVIRAELSQEIQRDLQAIERGEFSGNLQDFGVNIASEIESLRGDMAEIARAITSGTSGLPVRENLEAPAIILIPTDTPFRNRLPRTVGSGLASAWRQISSLGGGWGSSLDQPGGGTATQTFVSETGAPAQFTTTYVAKTASYKIMRTYGQVSDFAAAAGASYTDQRQLERRNALNNMMLNEENALLNADSTSTAAPWGDGTSPFSFDGILKLTSTANGTPSAQVQTTVGAFTLDHVDAQIARLWKQGAENIIVLLNMQEMTSWQSAVRDRGDIRSLVTIGDTNATAGYNITRYVHPGSGRVVELIVDRFMPAGTIEYIGMTLPDGSPCCDVQVLPQAPMPAGMQRPDGTNQMIQGYTVQEIARNISSPGMEPFVITIFEVLRLKSANHVAKSTGVTAYVPA